MNVITRITNIILALNNAAKYHVSIQYDSMFHELKFEIFPYHWTLNPNRFIRTNSGSEETT
ncbi:MAG: hypothetical protein LUF90_08950 [Rikenellaceae bacterium]|nr:hypothetical protein [Rikenellaceae bacterium]